MLDFTAARYLGLRHASGELGIWAQLTTGVPAALRESPTARAVVTRAAELLGCRGVVVSPSTLHAFWDVFSTLRMAQGGTVHVDAAAYPIAGWGARGAVDAAALVPFRHHSAPALARALAAAPRRRPVVVTDGWCPGCGRAAPLGRYLGLVRKHDGWLVIDDTQGVGLLGRGPSPDQPYGFGGSGTVAWSGLSDARVIVVASLAKGLGVPLAITGGGATVIDALTARGPTRLHCSPPSEAELHAARRALDDNRRTGDRRRRRLLEGVLRFRQTLVERGRTPTGGPFPVQSIVVADGAAAARVHDRLARSGVRTVVVQPRCSAVPRVTFLISAAHSGRALDVAAEVLDGVLDLEDRRSTTRRASA